MTWIARIKTFAIVCGLLTWAAPASAQEVCVSCANPEAVYRCSIEKSEKLARFGRGGERAVHLVCAKELARQGGHASCAVRRDTAVADCAGEQRMLSSSTLMDVMAPAESPAPIVPPATAEINPTVPGALPPAKPVDAADVPPRTMQELAERTSAKSKQQLKDAGATVGNVFERSWDCLSSFFKRC